MTLQIKDVFCRFVIQARGRNNYMQCQGISIHRFSNSGEVILNPITSKGEISDGARIVIRPDALGAVITALAQIFLNPDCA